MAKRTRFAPHYDASSRRWILNVPSQFSETGKRQRLFYPDQEKALNAALALRERREHFGVSLSSLSPVRLAEASEAYKLLDALEQPTSLLSVVREWIHHKERQTSSKTILETFGAYLESKPHLARGHRDQIRNAKDKLAPLHKVLVSDVTPTNIQEILSPLSGSTRNRYMRILRGVFNFAIKRAWCQENPIDRLDFAKLNKKTVEIFTNKEIKSMLLRSLKVNIDMLPYFALGAFAGLRVGSGELSKLLWSDIKFEGKQIVVRAEIAKTKSRRFIPISPTLERWLDLYMIKGGDPTGLVIKIPYGTLRKLRKKIYPLKWIQAGLRHTYASNMINSGKTIDETCLALGHRGDPNLLWNHYYLATSKEEAEAFWEIQPKFT